MILMIAKLDLMADRAMGKQESFGKFKTLNREDVNRFIVLHFNLIAFAIIQGWKSQYS